MAFPKDGTPSAPCATCERKGCGAFHDKCELFQKYKDEVKAHRQSLNARNPYKGDSAFEIKRRKSREALDSCVFKMHKYRTGREDEERWD